MKVYVDIILSALFLWISNPGKYSNTQTSPTISTYFNKLFSPNFFANVIKSIDQILYRHETYDYGIFSVVLDKSSTWHKIGIGGIWIHLDTYLSSVSGLGLYILFAFLLYNCVHSYHYNKAVYRHSVVITMILICSYILLSQEVEIILHSLNHTYWDIPFPSWNDYTIQSRRRVSISPIYSMAMLIIPPITWYFVPKILKQLNIEIINHNGNIYYHDHINSLCITCILWTMITCYLSFLTNFNGKIVHNDFIIWNGLKLEYRQISIGLIPVMLFTGNLPGIIGYILGYVIASVL